MGPTCRRVYSLDFAANVEPPAPQSVHSQSFSMWSSTFLIIKCRQKGIRLVSMFTKHNEPVCIFGRTVTAFKAKNMVSAGCGVLV